MNEFTYVRANNIWHKVKNLTTTACGASIGNMVGGISLSTKIEAHDGFPIVRCERCFQGSLSSSSER